MKVKQRATVVCSTGFHGAAKAELQAQVALLGGGASLSGDLVRGSTTHLVCRRLLDAFGSARYRMALEWGIHVVSYRWLADSAPDGFRD
ncbi:MAG: hypothetical protein J3K34DRAFT_467007 [Monoraphidium minutum]|nr:MAG: hypothetical protein J3K34DRAFT_467007 [Monoraphidium minutum]